MSLEIVKQRLQFKKSVCRIGAARQFKFLLGLLGNEDHVISFLINELNYKKYQANKIVYDINYRKQRYQQKVNKLSTPHIDSYQKQPIKLLL